MKLITLLLFIQLFYQFGNGAWLYGFRIGSTAVAIDSNGNCAKFTGVEEQCTEYDHNLAISLKNMYK